MRYLSLFAFLLFFLSLPLHAAENAYLPLRGHLDPEAVERAQERLKDIEGGSYSQLVIELSSSTGDIKSILELSREIYEAKRKHRFNVVVYIDDNAVGPAGMLPFLADEVYTSYFVSWGDIPLGTDDTLPPNLLKNQVVGLISEQNKHATLLTVMAKGMIDQNLIISSKDGKWIVGQGNVISGKGERLIVNHKQLQNLGLVTQVLGLAEFRKKFIAPDQEPDVKTAAPEASKDLNTKLQEYIKFEKEGKNKIGYIAIDNRKSGINQSTWIYVKSALDYYKEHKPSFIILKLNTPGGEVFSAQKISDALKEMDTIYEVPVVAFIDNWAISAGAMLAYSCRFIAITKDAAMGAAEPVLQTTEGTMASASEKINSALRADFANRAGFFGRNQDIAEAMVDKDIILVMRHGKIMKLDSMDDLHKTGPDPDKVISAKGKLLTLNANELMGYGVANIKLQPEKLIPITSAEESTGEWPASKELLFEYSFFNHIPNAVIDAYRMDWKTQFLTLLAHPMVASMLFLGMMLGFYVEINSPGFGFPGSLALICLVLVVLSSFALEAVGMLEVIFIGIGIGLIVADLLLIPTFGLLGGVGVFFLIVGIMGLMIPGLESVDYDFDTNTFNAAGQFVMVRLVWLSATFVVGIILIALMAKYVMPNFTPFSRFVLNTHEEVGYIAGENPQNLPQKGEEGVVVAMLRPGGKVLIRDTIYDAMSTGEFIEANAKIKVAYLDGSQIMVKRVE